MKISIESTSEITDIDGVPVRHWKGKTDAGTPCHVFVHRIAVHNHLAGAFETELAEMDPPNGPQWISPRDIL